MKFFARDLSFRSDLQLQEISCEILKVWKYLDFKWLAFTQLPQRDLLLLTNLKIRPHTAALFQTSVFSTFRPPVSLALQILWGPAEDLVLPKEIYLLIDT